MENTGAWATDLAGMLKTDTREDIGATLGSVISVKPLKISILDGLVVIQSDIHEIYMARHLKKGDKTETNGDIKFKDTNCGTVKVGLETGTVETLNVSTSFTASTKNETGLKKDDTVLIIPDETESTFFIVDVLDKV